MRKIESAVIEDLVDWFRKQESPPSIAECMERSGLSRDSVRRYLAKNGLSVPSGTRAGSSRGSYSKVEKKCPCGNRVFTTKYCSHECILKYGKTGRTYGSRKSAVCLGCGEAFTRPASYPSTMKYCSNRCAKKEQKRGWSKTAVVLGEDVLILRSMYELRFVAVCERRGWDWRSYDGPDIQTSAGTYRPDFIVNGRTVEVKGLHGEESRTKVEEAREQGHDIWLVQIDELKELENA